jgi:hypothetical protein
VADIVSEVKAEEPATAGLLSEADPGNDEANKDQKIEVK